MDNSIAKTWMTSNNLPRDIACSIRERRSRRIWNKHTSGFLRTEIHKLKNINWKIVHSIVFPIWVMVFRWLLFLLLRLLQIDLNAEWAEGVDLLSLFSPIDNIWCANLPGNYRDHKNYPKLYFLGSQIESEKTVVTPWM